MPKSYVVHCKKDKYDIYCGRPTVWGNSFEIGKDGDRDEVIKKYERWIICGDGQYLLKDIGKLKGKILACWCNPNPCHCDILHLLSYLFNPKTELYSDAHLYYNYYLEGFVSCFNNKIEEDNPYLFKDDGESEESYYWINGHWDCANYLNYRKGLYR